MFEWPLKSESTSGLKGADDTVLWIVEIFRLFMFSRSGNPLLIFLQSYFVWVTSKIWVNFRFKGTSKVLIILSDGYHHFFTIYVFEVKKSIVYILTELRCSSGLDNPSQLLVWEVLMILSYEFLKFLHYSCFRGQRIHSVTSRHATSWHVMSRRKLRDGHTTNAPLSTDFFHTQLIWI